MKRNIGKQNIFNLTLARGGEHSETISEDFIVEVNNSKAA